MLIANVVSSVYHNRIVVRSRWVYCRYRNSRNLPELWTKGLFHTLMTLSKKKHQLFIFIQIGKRFTRKSVKSTATFTLKHGLNYLPTTYTFHKQITCFCHISGVIRTSNFSHKFKNNCWPDKWTPKSWRLAYHWNLRHVSPINWITLITCTLWQWFFFVGKSL